MRSLVEFQERSVAQVIPMQPHVIQAFDLGYSRNDSIGSHHMKFDVLPGFKSYCNLPKRCKVSQPVAHGQTTEGAFVLREPSRPEVLHIGAMKNERNAIGSQQLLKKWQLFRRNHGYVVKTPDCSERREFSQPCDRLVKRRDQLCTRPGLLAPESG